MDFVGFPKIPRYSRECVITEKIDGTNAQITIIPEEEDNPYVLAKGLSGDCSAIICAGSRTRWLTLESDNFGFAKWVATNSNELLRLGPGRHFGEWWGQGIQRGYGLKEKRFSLFNVKRWGDDSIRPTCCHVVPIVWTGPFCSEGVMEALCRLQVQGSFAAPGFMKPEGIVIYHVPGNILFKKTIEKDEKGKDE